MHLSQELWQATSTQLLCTIDLVVMLSRLVIVQRPPPYYSYINPISIIDGWKENPLAYWMLEVYADWSMTYCEIGDGCM